MNKNNLLLIGGGLFSVGAILMVFMSIPILNNWYSARTWKQTLCTIEEAFVKEHYSNDGETYSIQVKYHFENDGKTLHGKNYSFNIGSSSGFDSKQTVVDMMSPGTQIKCYFKPDEPKRSVIDRSIGSAWIWIIFPIPFLLSGIFITRYRSTLEKMMPTNE